MPIHHLVISLLILIPTLVSAQQNLYEAGPNEYGHAFAGSNILDTQAPGGFGVSSNLPKENANALDFAEDALYLHVETESDSLFKGRYAANVVYLVNQSDLNYSFPAADSRLHLFAEIFFQDQWIAVERMPLIRCGNSYHQLTLGPNQYWTFNLPKYDGTASIKMRYRLTRVFGESDEHEPFKELISPEFNALYPIEHLTPK